jgi:hypothetical protein
LRFRLMIASRVAIYRAASCEAIFLSLRAK